MAWMKLDDRFHASRKINSIPKRHRFQAAGLWAIAGSWVAGQGTDGFVPDYMIQAWGPTDKTVESLVNAGLWKRESSGFSFDSWLEYNPSKEQTESERAASAERMRKSRERRRSERAGQEVGQDDVAPQQAGVLHRNASEVLQRPDPTRPDPTHKEREVGSSLTDAREDDPAPSQDDRIDSALAAYAAERDAEQAAIPPGVGEIPSDWCTHSDPRCRTHANWERDQVPACRQCANVREWFEEQSRAEVEAHRAQVQSCQWCDDRGLINTHDTAGRPVALQCEHQGPPPAVEADAGHRELTSAEKRRQLIDQAFNRPTTGPF